MKRNFIFITIAIFFGMMSISSSAFAGWYTVTINKVGGTSTGIRVQITDDNKAFTNTWYEVAGPKSDQILASILTAVSLDKKLYVQLATTTAYSDLTGCFLINQ